MTTKTRTGNTRHMPSEQEKWVSQRLLASWSTVCDGQPSFVVTPLLSRSCVSTHEVQALSNTVGCCSGFRRLYLTRIDLTDYTPSRHIQQSEYKDQDNYKPPASASSSMYTSRDVQTPNDIHASCKTYATYDHRDSTAPAVSI